MCGYYLSYTTDEIKDENLIKATTFFFEQQSVFGIEADGVTINSDHSPSDYTEKEKAEV
jgi:hypothetical protein